MKTGAVIAEYNPFHSGHAYQIQRYREENHPDAVIAVMSEDFVQRGEPACTIYENRVRAALACGVDVVIGLPVWFSTASAGVFAAGGVSLLNACGCIDELFFGCDSDHHPDILLEAYTKASLILSEEPDIYKEALGTHLRRGDHFALARAKALKACGLDGTMFDSPNNILALSYINALRATDSSIRPILIPRAGSGYHDLDTDGALPSASGIRKVWRETNDPEGFNQAGGMPEAAKNIYKEAYLNTLPVGLSDFDAFFAMALHEHSDHLNNYADMSPDLANRIRKNKDQYTGLESFIDQVTNRSLTKTRVSRACLHMMLDIVSDLCSSDHVKANTPYLRILGFKKSAAPVLNMISKSATVPVITKPSQYKKQLCDEAGSLFEKDLSASLLYRTAARIKFQNPELPHPFASGVIIQRD